MYDVLIIGAGPAGLTAAIYSARRGLKTLVLTRDIGGQITKTLDIENYPGILEITGTDLASKMYEQASKFGVEIKFEGADQIESNNGVFTVKSASAQYESKTIILAFGKSPKKLEVPGEDKFIGKGVSYCATCDVPFFKDKVLAVVGGGNSALDAALLASNVCKQVYLIHRRDEFRGEEVLIDKVKGTSNINLILNTTVKEIQGADRVEHILLENNQKIEADGIIIEVGYAVDRTLAAGLVNLDERNQIVINENQETNIPGIFAAGDLTTTPYKQIVIAAGEGAKAALACYNYIQIQVGGKKTVADWH